LFTEKLNWRIVYDRRPILQWTCDKLRMKAHASSSSATVLVPRTIWSGRNTAELRSVELAGAWVFKPNHRSGSVHFGCDRITDVEHLELLASRWLEEYRGIRLGEWAYAEAEPTLLLEERIGEPGTVPIDYKFFVFDGVTRMIQVDTGRFVDHRRRLFTPDWTPLPHRNVYPIAPVMPPPRRLSEMLAIASDIGHGFDFIRVDLYDRPEGVYFGEITPYPGGGLEAYDPRDLDGLLGSYWKLPSPTELRTAD